MSIEIHLLNSISSNLVKIACEWRAEQPESRAETGVVLIYEGNVYGWKNNLRNANHERPGVYAVDVDNHVFVAEAGDDYNGAKGWVLVSDPCR